MFFLLNLLLLPVCSRWWWCRPSAHCVRSIPGSTASWWTSCPTCSEMTWVHIKQSTDFRSWFHYLYRELGTKQKSYVHPVTPSPPPLSSPPPLPAGRVRLQAGHRGLHHQHHRGEPREQGDGPGPPVRVHRGLRAHGAGHQDPAPAGQRGAAHAAALQVHPLHLQPRGAGERGRPGRWDLQRLYLLTSTDGHITTCLPLSSWRHFETGCECVCVSFSSAAVSALAKFGAQNDDLLPSVLVLMQRWFISLVSLSSSVFECAFCTFMDKILTERDLRN